jgi:glutamine cyclotransferase
MHEASAMNRILVVIVIFIAQLYGQLGDIGDHTDDLRSMNAADSVPVYGYEIINTYPHDTMAFTQGLIYRNGFMYEGTGLYSHSQLRKVDLETGTVLKIYNLPSNYFGEGITIYNDTIVQLTWLNNVGFEYVEGDSFVLVDSFDYPWSGWGLTHTDTCLILSDGTPTIHFLDPYTYQEIGTLDVQADGVPVDDLNELEFIQGKIYANVWYHDSIAIIDPLTGDVTEWLNLYGILGMERDPDDPDVLNGIAYDTATVRLFVTGKLWPTIFEIEVDPLNYPPHIEFFHPPSPVYVPVDSVVILSVSADDPDPEDSLIYIWSVDGAIDTSAHDTSYAYSNSSTTCDTVMVMVDDGMFQASNIWVVYVSSVVVESGSEMMPSIHTLNVVPNPAHDEAIITYGVPHREHVRIQLYDVTGRLVMKVTDEEKEAGCYRCALNAKTMKPGIYFICFNGEFTRKIVVLP